MSRSGRSRGSTSAAPGPASGRRRSRKTIVAGAAGQRVAARPADEPVAAGAAARSVVAAAAEQPVGAGLADDRRPRPVAARSSPVPPSMRSSPRPPVRRSSPPRPIIWLSRSSGVGEVAGDPTRRWRRRRRPCRRRRRRRRAPSRRRRRVLPVLVARSAAVERRARRRRPRGAGAVGGRPSTPIPAAATSGPRAGSPSSATGAQAAMPSSVGVELPRGALVLAASRVGAIETKVPLSGSYQVALAVPSVPPAKPITVWPPSGARRRAEAEGEPPPVGDEVDISASIVGRQQRARRRAAPRGRRSCRRSSRRRRSRRGLTQRASVTSTSSPSRSW